MGRPGTSATSDPTVRPHPKVHQIHPEDQPDPFAISSLLPPPHHPSRAPPPRPLHSRSQALRRQLRKSPPVLAEGDVIAGPDTTVVRSATLRLRHFATMQEAARKDVERAFGVLQPRWGIVRSAAMKWESETLWQLMICYVIMHNMIVEDEGDGVTQTHDFEAPG